ncbi:adenosylcobinamide kinase/adenosylcobinamide phosphate guanyltransferase [Epidermidibacterium keratini]|uniref:Adenosylcobinamide kinase n=1 Tax=Epidermidibacterium keratini TaxID=1891644 RepID=A0A7L4YPM2_9ACTN|nr:bifunctional adenosylcobinamide kinase/adenosylcobinamide-phosphate guanylyltransferase [Epidermidibacterium keratini]QHC00834.1 adenosylcobinamide kinase/adenosylcobinamide phosphate guanyltransferase [Epidermidibacterium keratini]
MARRTLVTGGVRSGKSAYAESLVADAADVLYVAPGPAPDPDADAEWAARVAAHQLRRPTSWETRETSDIADAMRAATGPVLVDCLGTWVTAVVDELRGWDRPHDRWAGEFDERLDAFADAWAALEYDAVAVTNEVGWGVIPAHHSGRLFRDLLGRVNQRVAAASDDVVLVVAGRTLTL